ncbi:hypothetical protein ADICYQ_5301 [Cyclobacterium qasimii M12-11B]|uniref:Uncharacterized protein n=1 Tax=Cyclobacterium qasimii M12-11B TaxID=641524 RepID=S7V6W9_9BACT|nr:hypothetical protein ADICYQ_5301 [Cyclobacterium qasimii M12-11B]
MLDKIAFSQLYDFQEVQLIAFFFSSCKLLNRLSNYMEL